MTELTALESAVIDVLLPDDLPEAAILREQLRSARVSSREMTGVGFFTEFTLSGDAPVLPENRSLHLGNVAATCPDVEHGMGFVLFVREGKITMLEGYTYDEPWPDELGEFQVLPAKLQK